MPLGCTHCVGLATESSNEPVRRLKFHNHGKGPDPNYIFYELLPDSCLYLNNHLPLLQNLPGAGARLSAAGPAQPRPVQGGGGGEG